LVGFVAIERAGAGGVVCAEGLGLAMELGRTCELLDFGGVVVNWVHKLLGACGAVAAAVRI